MGRRSWDVSRAAACLQGLSLGCKGPRGCSTQASPCDAGGSCTSPCAQGQGPSGGGLHPAAAPKTWRTSKAGQGLQPGRKDILLDNDTTLTKLRYAHYSYFLYLLLGKSHFKDLCYLEAKLFFLSMECSFLLFHHKE